MNTVAKPMTSEELFALPHNKLVERWLFRGELRESKVTKRNPSHSEVVTNTARELSNWRLVDPATRGKVYTGEVYFRIRRDPDTNVGIDVAVATPEQAAATGKKASFVDGPPVLAVEVLSPYDKLKEIKEAIYEYLDCGVEAVWIIDPYDETVTVYQPGHEPRFYTREQQLSGDPVLPGFACSVAALFS